MIHYFNDILPCYLIFDSIIFKKKEKYQEKNSTISSAVLLCAYG